MYSIEAVAHLGKGEPTIKISTEVQVTPLTSKQFHFDMTIEDAQGFCLQLEEAIAEAIKQK